MLATATLASAILGAASVAFCGRRHRHDQEFRSGQGHDHFAQRVELHGSEENEVSDLKVGEKMTVSYTEAGDKMDFTSIKPAT